MQHFLDAPIDEMINNDLNEVRHYRHLSTKVLLLNSVSGASSLRTNKVSLNDNVLNRLWNQVKSEWSDDENTHRVCLAHHSLEYVPDYVLDSYFKIPGYIPESKPLPEKDGKHPSELHHANRIYNSYVGAVKHYNSLNKTYDDFIALFNSAVDEVKEIASSNNSNYNDEEINDAKDILNSRLYKDASFFSE